MNWILNPFNSGVHVVWSLIGMWSKKAGACTDRRKKVDLELVEIDVSRPGLRGIALAEAVLPDVCDDSGQALLELVEIFLVKEYLVLVERERAVTLLLALALCDGEIVVVAALGGFDVEEICTLAGPDRLGEYVLAVPVTVTRPVEILSVHGLDSCFSRQK